MSKIKKAGGWVGKQMILPYTRLFGSMRDLGTTTAAAVSTVSQTAKKVGRQTENDDPVVAQGRQINDGRERFDFYYQQWNWTPHELEQQARMLVKAQSLYLAYTVVALAILAATVAMFSGWGWLAIGGAACAWAAAVVCGCSTIRSALMLAQLDNRELLEFKQFMGRDDAWRRLLMPWSRSQKTLAAH